MLRCAVAYYLAVLRLNAVTEILTVLNIPYALPLCLEGSPYHDEEVGAPGHSHAVLCRERAVP